MRLQILAGALALAGPSIAFSDSSPLVLLSTSKFVDASASNNIQTSSQATENAKNILSGCPSDRYLLVSHPGVRSVDLASGGASQCADSAMPYLCKAIENPHLRGKYIVSEVVGESTKDGLASYITKACAEKKREVTIEEVSLPPVTSDRAGSLSTAASSLATSFDELASSDSYTLLYMGTPNEQAYEPEFDGRVRMDLKRDLRASPMKREDKNAPDNRPLFEKCQFFTPGIFMALITAVVLFSILGVGLKALASLEVSYGAFEKDMGPAAQRKQQ